MHSASVLRILLVTGFASSLTLSALRGQGPVRTSALPPAAAVVPSWSTPAQEQAPPVRGQTTFLERAAWGAGAGLLGVAAASALVDSDGDAWVAIPLIGAASAAGVMLVTAKREGARPVSTVLGTAVAMTLPTIVLLSIDSGPEGPGPEVYVGFAVLLSAPLGAAAGHGLGVR